MPSITPEEVKKIAKLARLELTDEEISAATRDLSNILAHFSAIQDIDTSGVTTADSASGLTNITREDTAQPDSITDAQAVMDNVPDTKDGHIKVTAVFS